MFLEEGAEMIPRPRRSALGQPRQRLGGVDDGDTLVLPELKQVGVPRNYQIGFRRYGAGEHVIVVGVAEYNRGNRCGVR